MISFLHSGYSTFRSSTFSSSTFRYSTFSLSTISRTIQLNPSSDFRLNIGGSCLAGAWPMPRVPGSHTRRRPTRSRARTTTPTTTGPGASSTSGRFRAAGYQWPWRGDLYRYKKPFLSKSTPKDLVMGKKTFTCPYLGTQCINPLFFIASACPALIAFWSAVCWIGSS